MFCSWLEMRLQIKIPYPHKITTKHYNNVIMSTMASQITSLTIVYLTVYSRRISKETPKLRVTGLCEGNSPVTSNAEKVSIWWRHHGLALLVTLWEESIGDQWVPLTNWPIIHTEFPCHNVILKLQTHQWWRHYMQTSSSLLALCGGHPPVASGVHSQRVSITGFEVFFVLYRTQAFGQTVEWCDWKPHDAHVTPL